MPIKPKHISAGDTIGIVSPSSPSTYGSDLERLRGWADEHDFRLKFFPHANDKHAYLAGSDEDRAADLTAAFADPGVDAVLTMRGGTGGWRMVRYVDYDVIRDNPKFFSGYSDTTAIHLAIESQADIVTFYGASGSSLIGKGRSKYTEKHFLRALTEPVALGEVEKDPDDPFTWSITEGVAEGLLRGGCLTLLAQSAGTPYQPDWSGCIVFFEDVGEQPYRLDGYLTQLTMAGMFDGVAGVVVGEHVQCGSAPYKPSYPYGSFTSEEVFQQHLGPLGVPVMVGLPCGHGRHLATLPLGVMARLDTDNLSLTLLEEATTT
jgi:muramoyltetrapeptide carboxypeptidase